MSGSASINAGGSGEATLIDAIARFAREASIEMNVQDVADLQASRVYLPVGKRIYVSHLPKQSWDDTLLACRAAHRAGLEPIPHVPVRLIESGDALDRFLATAVREGGVREVLLVAGDYAQALGPYSRVAEVLDSRKLNEHGIARVSLAGHPEGHPSVSLDVIRAAEAEKSQLAVDAGLTTTLLTQFFFESAPFLEWVGVCRAAGIQAHLVGGLSGPANAATLFKFAMRCGVGPSIRALGARPTSFVRLLGEHGPERVIRELALAHDRQAQFDGLHFFCFGGFLRTCEWLSRVAGGRLALQPDGFSVY